MGINSQFTNKKAPSKKGKNKNNNKNVLTWIIATMAILWLVNLMVSPQFVGIGTLQEINYGEFYRILKNDPTSIQSLAKSGTILEGEFADGKRFRLDIPEDDKDLLALIRESVSNFAVKPDRNVWLSLFFSLAPVGLFILFLWYFSYRGSEMGNKLWSFGKAKTRLSQAGDKKQKFTFNDVAGVDEAKEELKEVIAFLVDPRKFQKLGGKIPKGVLLVGPPGCGKTLIAKAVAGEAGVPFFSISGSDFVEMFVGVGASRVRDLFDQGRKAAKLSGKGAIIFIDEIDAVGRLRFSGIGGGHDEREQTLNQLLVEMDGFDAQEGVILVAATNRPDTLDPALLRPGRFDRHVVIDRPDIKGREEILKVHVRKIKLNAKVDLALIARQTPGFSGADLANLCNEAALLAARNEKDSVTTEEMEAAIERVIAGPERKSRVISKREKEITAYHESGHALISLLIPDVDPLHKVSILPRGIGVGGYTINLPLQDRYFITKKELLARITLCLGGRASEVITFQDFTSGAGNDLEIATGYARNMVMQLGMSDKLGHLTFGRRNGMLFLGKDLTEERNYSEETARKIDEEIRRIIDDCYLRAKTVLLENHDKLDKLANVLLEREVLDGEEVKKILGLETVKPEAKSKAKHKAKPEDKQKVEIQKDLPAAGNEKSK